MNALYPLRFAPLFRRYLWGGRRLATQLRKTLSEGDDYAESWEVVDHGDDQSVVVAGPLAGATLRELVRDFPRLLYGDAAPSEPFPLLFKFLDANQNLSVQVHPNDTQGARLSPPDLGKTEAWVILDAAPGSRVYAGLKRGFDRAALMREVARGTTELCLHSIHPRAGDCFFIPAGTVHALGAGLLVAEIQQSSDTTFRLYDWNRTGPDGTPRELHIEQALDTIDYERGPIEPQTPTSTSRDHVERLVACDQFVLDRWHFDAPQPLLSSRSGPRGFHLLAVLAGEITVDGDPSGQPLTVGQTMLVPDSAAASSILSPRTDTTLLDIYLP